ncbi:MAG: GntR family transcriptional regulator [Yoonia sp.]|nr:GntR family transcriptional regulator [Yoonia sp.]
MLGTAEMIDADKMSTAETIQTELLHRICFLDYRPGDQLKEAELAAEFGVSRTPVRDAINRISHLGLVETLNGVGTVVVALSVAKIQHVYEMRLELAALIGTMSPREITAQDRATAGDLLREAMGLSESFDPRQYVALNHRLHQLIASLIGNSVLQSFWWQTYYQAASTWYGAGNLMGPDVAAALIHELRDIVIALENNDTKAIGFIQRTHIGYGYQRIKTHLIAQETT